MEIITILSRFSKFRRNFSKHYTNFFSKLKQILLKLILFLIFAIFYRQFHSHLFTFYQFFCKFPKLFFNDLLPSLDKVTVEICTNFYFALLKNFLAIFKNILKFFSTLKLFFSKN